MRHVDTAKTAARLTIERLRLKQSMAQQLVLQQRLDKVQARVANKTKLIASLEQGLSTNSDSTTSSTT